MFPGSSLTYKENSKIKLPSKFNRTESYGNSIRFSNRQILTQYLKTLQNCVFSAEIHAFLLFFWFSMTGHIITTYIIHIKYIKIMVHTCGELSDCNEPFAKKAKK